MCDDGEKTCPLCAEEMDLTDQQLKPCKCGYEICVWCWHHITEMAEKDETEGRCPACRTPYDKEKIVRMASKCERLVAEINMEKKTKSHKMKARSSEGRKQLSGVRVIQRNLVYVVGLPLNLADEDILQRKEYFGQYGKVLKVSMSRTAAGVIQQFTNNTCSVYITYSKEEEAIRCIQCAHGFTLEGRPLRACFGTTKYCHAWLLNMPCNNPDCLYLHEVGPQEDSFTKDETVSAYIRSRVQQITANVNTAQKRSGNTLPPPHDDHCNGTIASPGKPVVKNPLNNAAIGKGSSPNGSTGRSMALPAAASWGTHALSWSSQAISSECSTGSSKQKSNPPAGGGAVEDAVLHTDVLEKPPPDDASYSNLAKKKVDPSNASSCQYDLGAEFSSSDKCCERYGSLASTTAISSRQACVSSNKCSSTTETSMLPSEGAAEFSSCSVEAEGNIRKIQSLSYDPHFIGSKSSSSVNESVQHDSSGVYISESLVSDPHFIGSLENQGLCQRLSEEQYNEPLTLPEVSKAVPSGDESSSTHNVHTEVEDDVLSFDNQRLQDPEVLIAPRHISGKFTSNLLQPHNIYHDNMSNGFVYASSGSVIPNGTAGISLNSAASQMNVQNNEKSIMRGTLVGTLHEDATNCQRNGASDPGESSIISNILSLDFDPWNDSLASPHSLAKLLGGSDEQQGSINATNNWKVHSNRQSRFSFARQEESISQLSDAELPFCGYGQLPRNRSISEDKEFYLHKLGTDGGFPPYNSAEIGNFVGSQSATKKSSAPRSQISVPPGFSMPSKHPPGFSSHERLDQTFDLLAGNRLLDLPPLMRSTEKTQLNGSIGSFVDIEFMDPAILAVGKGRPQSYSSLGDAYRVPPRILDESPTGNLNYTQLSSFQQGKNSVIANGCWNGWNEMQGGGNGNVMAELLRNEGLGINKLLNGFEESKFRMATSGDLYGRTTFRM